jgi:NADH-quinone oxidoreductase subunit B
MEVIRHGGGGAPSDKSDFRSRQLSARAMLRGDLEGPELEQYVEERLLFTTLGSTRPSSGASRTRSTR